MAEFAKYAFNKSHAAAYAYVGYQTAYLKCYYEVEFLTAVLNNRITNIDEIKKYTTFAKKEGIDILPPNINKSITEFKVEKGNIRFGLAGLRNVGSQVVDTIIEERNKNGEFKSFEDFVSRVDGMALNKRCLESLIMSGAFDCFGKHRSQLMQVYPVAVERAVKEAKNRDSGQISMFGGDLFEDKSFTELSYPNIKEYNKETILKNEKEFVGIYLSGHPLDSYLDKFDGFTFTSDMIQSEEGEEEFENEEAVQSHHFQEGQVVTCGGIIVEKKKLTSKKSNKDMAFLKVEDLYGNIEVAVMPNIYPKFKMFLEEDNLISVKGKISLRNDIPSVIAEDIIPWQKEEQDVVKEKKDVTLYIRCNTKDFDNFNKVKDVLANYYGNSPVIIKCTSTNKAFSYSQKVNVNNYLLNELYGIIGEDNVIAK